MMCRQLTIIAESLPVRETLTVDMKRFKGEHTHTHTEARPALPKREILCLTRAASLQNRLEKNGRRAGKELDAKRINAKHKKEEMV